MKQSACILVLLCALVSPTQVQAQKLIHSERSLYREVLVYEQDGERCMCFTRGCRIGRQTCMNTQAPARFVMNYTRMMMSALFIDPQPKSILIVGLGGGTLPNALHQLLPTATIDVVEIDPAVVRVAERFFGFRKSDRVRVAEMDGRVFVKRAGREGRRYDLVMLDAFDHEYIPEHLLTKEFLEEVAALLSPEGVLAANTFSSSRLYDYESVTYAAVFGTFFNLKTENRVILARKNGLPPIAQVERNAAQLKAPFARLGIDIERNVALFSTRVDWDRQTKVLTDQFSPANLLNLRE